MLTPSRPRPSGSRRLLSGARRLVDVCPLCSADMGGRSGGTRRIGLTGSRRGLFLWECPECAGRWEQAPGGPALPLPVASLRLRPRPPAA